MQGQKAYRESGRLTAPVFSSRLLHCKSDLDGTWVFVTQWLDKKHFQPPWRIAFDQSVRLQAHCTADYSGSDRQQVRS
jgi:hypothetical protein